MAKKRLTLADAKKQISTLEESLKDALLIQDNNVYDRGEQKFIKIYQWGFYISLIGNVVLLSLLFG